MGQDLKSSLNVMISVGIMDKTPTSIFRKKFTSLFQVNSTLEVKTGQNMIESITL